MLLWEQFYHQLLIEIRAKWYILRLFPFLLQDIFKANNSIFIRMSVFKGLRPVLEGFVVPMHEGTWETGSQIPRDLTYCSHKPECIGTTNPDRSVLITIITWPFQFHPMNVSNLHVKGTYVFEVRAVSRAPPIATSRGAPEWRELLPHNTRHQGKLCSWDAASDLQYRRV